MVSLYMRWPEQSIRQYGMGIWKLKIIISKFEALNAQIVWNFAKPNYYSKKKKKKINK